MKKIIIIGTKIEADFISKRIKNPHMYSFVVIHSVDVVGEYILDMLDAYCIINAFVDGYLATYTYNVLSSIDLLKDKVIHFLRIANALVPQMTVDRVMSNPYVDEYDCIILGLSHAEVGIVPEIMPFRVANIAVSSQDIYYNLESLKYCIEKYSEKIANIKKVYIDMFDYTYFNYDTSLSSTILMYYSVGGIFLPHNIIDNKNLGLNEFNDGVLNYVRQKMVEGITNEHLKIWDELFDNIMTKSPEYLGYRNKPFLELREKTFDPNKCVSSNLMNTGIINKKHEKTISENIIHFRQLMELLMEINSNMEINLVITPQHQICNIEGNTVMQSWKQEFYSIIESLKSDYMFRLLDYRLDEMSGHDEYFYDAEHLNYMGAQVFTKKLLEV